MSQFVIKPNLPENCKTILIGEKYYKKLETSLKNLGISAIMLQDNEFISASVSSHADLSVCHLYNNRFALSDNLKGSNAAQFLADTGAELTYISGLKAEYPDEALMNVCSIGDYCFCANTASKRIVDNFTSRIYVKQGYTRCSTCIVDSTSIITADKGIADCAKANGFNILLIRPGYIDLPGYDYGFIGGASFKISKTNLAFTGTLDNHPDKRIIYEFLNLRGIEPVFLTDKPIFDIGTAIPVLEK